MQIQEKIVKLRIYLTMDGIIEFLIYPIFVCYVKLTHSIYHLYYIIYNIYIGFNQQVYYILFIRIHCYDSGSFKCHKLVPFQKKKNEMPFRQNPQCYINPRQNHPNRITFNAALIVIIVDHNTRQMLVIICVF